MSIDLTTICPSCGTDAWHGVAGLPGVYGCDGCGHSADYGCPDWCVRADHHAEEPTDSPLHYGPSFGPITPQSDLSRPSARAAVVLDSDELTANELRRLALHALTAAQWIDDFFGEHESLGLPTIERVAEEVGVDVARLAIALMDAMRDNR